MSGDRLEELRLDAEEFGGSIRWRAYSDALRAQHLQAVEAASGELWRIKVAADNGAPLKLVAIKRYADNALAALAVSAPDSPPCEACGATGAATGYLDATGDDVVSLCAACAKELSHAPDCAALPSGDHACTCRTAAPAAPDSPQGGETVACYIGLSGAMTRLPVARTPIRKCSNCGHEDWSHHPECRAESCDCPTFAADPAAPTEPVCPIDGGGICPPDFPACKCMDEGCYPGAAPPTEEGTQDA